MLGIVSYPAGNQTSVSRAFRCLGIETIVSADPGPLSACAGLVFPGVGAAGSAMAHLRATGLDGFLRAQVRAGQPLLGICLGCQILLEASEEDDTATLGLVPGVCRRFGPGGHEADGTPIRIPHMGWNSLEPVRDDPLFARVKPGAEFYFVHGYYPDPEPEYVLSRTEYGRRFCSVFGRPGLWAVQFHPEKSGQPGLVMLDNFHRYCQEKKNA